MKRPLLYHAINKTTMLLWFTLLCTACNNREESEGEPLPHFHFFNFVDEIGDNLFEIGKIPINEFYWITSTNDTIPWERLLELKEMRLSGMNSKEFNQTVDSLWCNNEYLLVENFQYTHELTRKYLINGVQYTFKLSPGKNGFFQNGEPLEYTTDTIFKSFLFVHNIVLNEY